MKGYYVYMIFIEKYVAECTQKDLEDLGKVTKRIEERLNRNLGQGFVSRLYMNGVIAVMQEDTHTLSHYLCMNRLEAELEQVLTSEYQTSFMYADYAVPEDHLEVTLYNGCLQYEHSLMVPNSRRVLEVGRNASTAVEISNDTSELQLQLHAYLQKGDYEQVRLIFTKMQSEYQNAACQNHHRMRYRLSLMNMLFSLSSYTEVQSEQLGFILFLMPMGRTWHRFMLSEMYRICNNRAGVKDIHNTANFLQMVHQRIDKEISNPNLNLKMASDAFGLTPSYFSTVFKKNMQMNFLSYVENKRMNMGYALLTQGDITVEKAAFACGYDNVSSFRRNFKKFYGRNPVDVLNGAGK